VPTRRVTLQRTALLFLFLRDTAYALTFRFLAGVLRMFYSGLPLRVQVKNIVHRNLPVSFIRLKKLNICLINDAFLEKFIKLG